MAIKIVLLTQWFDPEPTFKGLAFARELVRKGFNVEVVTGFPNYPGGKVYEGYRMRLLQREVIDGVQITRLPLYPSHDGSALRRIANYVSFAASSLLYGLFKLKRPDVIYAYHPPLTVGVTASLLRIIRRIPVVYDIQDMWPDTLRATGMLNNSCFLNAIGRLCDWVYRQVDEIVVLSPGFKKLLIDRGVSEKKISIIYNWADENSLRQSSGKLPELFLQAKSFKILFAGNMGKAQALDAVLQAANLLQNRKSRVQFLMVGRGIEVPQLTGLALKLGLKNIHFLPAVPMAEIGLYLSSADALLVHLRKDPLFQVTIPSKTQAYLYMGKPILMAVDGDAADLVLQSRAGVVADSENSLALAAAAERLSTLSIDDLKDMGNNARKYYEENLSISIGVGAFCKIFRKYM